MPPNHERVKRFVKEVKGWAKRHGIRNKDLAAMIGITPQGITEIFQGRNRPRVAGW
jgi:transcriptional regulator with XRE-family HTH domain